ncbi:MAG: MFS transporter [Chlamydiae bacterium]|nr:MFS transporter [Chlamydiota bacterium]
MVHKKKISLWLVLSIIFLDWTGMGLVYPMFSTMIFQPGSHLLNPNLSESLKGLYLGLLLSAMPITLFFSGPILGAISDQKGRRPLFLLSQLVMIFGYVISVVGVLVSSIWILILSRIVLGVATGNSSVVSASISDLSDEHNKTKNFALFSMAAGVGFTVGPFLGGRLSEASFAYPFVAAGLFNFLNLVFIYFFFQETNMLKKLTKIKITDGIKNLKKGFKVFELKIILITVFAFCLGWSFFYEFIPVTWIADYGFDSNTIGLFFGYGAGFYALSSGLLIRPILTKFKEQNILFYSLLVLGLFMLFLLSFQKNYLVWIYLPIVNFLVSLPFPTFTTIVSNLAAKDAQGEFLGILQSIQSISFALSPMIAGPLIGLSTHMPMLFGGLSILIAALIFFFFRKNKIFSKTEGRS